MCNFLNITNIGLNKAELLFFNTNHKHPATPTSCCFLSHFQLHICNSQHLVDVLLLFAVWHCAYECSSPSGYVQCHQPLVVAVDTRRHPVNAQRSLEINPECMSILAKQIVKKKHMHATTDASSPFCHYCILQSTHTSKILSTCRDNFDPFPLAHSYTWWKGNIKVNALSDMWTCIAHPTANIKLMNLTEPGGAVHLTLRSPLTFVALQVIDRLWFRVRIILLGCCTWILGGPTGTGRRQVDLNQSWAKNYQKGFFTDFANLATLAFNSAAPVTWINCQRVFLRSDVFILKCPWAHIASLISLFYIVDEDALLQASRKLEIRGEGSSGACFQT